MPHESGAVLYGGYSRVKASTGASGSGKQGKGGGGGGGGPQRVTLKPMVHQDTWFLRITPPAADAPSSAGPTVRWERRKKPANAPNPARAGVTMAHHKGRGIMFGGVHDVEMSEEGIDSEFFDTMFAWNLERNRFFPLTLRRPKAQGKKQQQQATKARDRSKADEEELLRNLAALEAKRGIRTVDADEDDMDIGSPASTEEVDAVKPAVVKFEMPHPRFNAQLTVQDDTLFVFGGTFERGDQEFIFNDMYSIDLVKLDGVKEIFYNEPANWNTQLEASDDEDEDEDEDEDMDDDEEENEAEEGMSVDTPSEAPTEITVPSVTREMQNLEVEETEGEPEAKDDRPQPRPFETLRDFFARTTTEWQNYLLEKLKQRGDPAEKTVKELRKEAFDLAEEKWWDSREEIMALEDEQEAAGIGEVVSMMDRAETSGGAGRRR